MAQKRLPGTTESPTDEEAPNNAAKKYVHSVGSTGYWIRISYRKRPQVDLVAYRQRQCIEHAMKLLSKSESETTVDQTEEQHWTALLSLDGGGIRGLTTIQVGI